GCWASPCSPPWSGRVLERRCRSPPRLRPTSQGRASSDPLLCVELARCSSTARAMGGHSRRPRQAHPQATTWFSPNGTEELPVVPLERLRRQPHSVVDKVNPSRPSHSAPAE